MPPSANFTTTADFAAPLRVVFFNWRDTRNPEGGGSELYVETVARGLATRGHNVTIFCAAYDDAPADESRDGVRFVRAGGRRTVYLQAAMYYLRGRLGRPDVLVDVQNGMPFLTRLWSRRPVVVLVHHVHREQWRVVFGAFMSRLGWFIESRVSPVVFRGCRYIAVSDVTRQELVGLGVRRTAITVVHNGTPLPPVCQPGRTSQPSISVVGRLVPHKRVEIALHTVARLRKEFPGLTLHIVGHGYWEPRLHEVAHDLRVEDAVVFYGYANEQTKHELLARTWVLAVPSLKEGWGLSVIEAATHGTPAVAFRAAGGLAESIADGQTGLLVDDLPSFAGAVRTLLRDEAMRGRFGAAARVRAGRYTWKAATDEFERLLAEATGTEVPPVDTMLPRRQPGSVPASL